MTELRDLLHERAEAAGLAPLDVLSLERAGTARVRRRHRAVIAVGVAAVLAVTGGVAALTGRPAHDDRPAEVVHDSRVGWAADTMIHGRFGTVDVGRPVNRYVQTDIGYVFSDQVGGVWSVVHGRMRMVGDTGGPLVGNPDSDLAAWADGSGRRLVFHILYQRTGRVLESTSTSRSTLIEGEYVDGGVIAVDGDTVYSRDRDGINDATLDPNRTSFHSIDLPAHRDLLTVGAGLSVETDRRTGATTIGPVGSGDRVDLPESGGSPLVSPTGQWVADGSAEGQGRAWIADAHTGAAVDLDPNAWTALPYQWLDADTVAVLTVASPTADYQLQVCSVETAHCAVAVPHLAPGPARRSANGTSFELPTGEHYFPYPHG